MACSPAAIADRNPLVESSTATHDGGMTARPPRPPGRRRERASLAAPPPWTRSRGRPPRARTRPAPRPDRTPPRRPRWSGRSCLPGDPVLDVRDAGRLDRPHLLEPRVADVLEEPLAVTEQDRNDVELELVDHPGGEVLPHDVGA